MNNLFSYKYKIKGFKNFVNIKRKGEKYNFFYFSIFLYKNKLSYNRIGIVVSRKVAGSVKRNRMKRLIREMFRLYYKEVVFLCGFHDIYFYINRDFSSLKLNILSEVFNKFCLEKKLFI